MAARYGIREPMKRLSLRAKLIVLLLTVALFALAAGFGINVATNIRLYKAETAASADNLTKVLAEFAVAPLLFADGRGGREILSRLETSQDVTAAAIYDAEGRLFASYVRPGSATDLPDTFAALSPGFEAQHFDAVRPVSYHEEMYGAVFTRLSTAELDDKIRGYVTQSALIFLAVLAVCAVLAYRLQRVISIPITRLASVAHRISSQEDYSLRVPVEGRDEIGRLYDAFNVMLSRIESRQRERDAASARLRESESKYRAIVQDQTDLVFRLAADGTLLFANEAYVRFFGRRFEQLVGTSHLDDVHREDLVAARSHLAALDAERSVGQLVYRVERSDGRVRWLDATFRAIVDDTGRVSEIQGVGRDVTELKRAEEEKTELARQLEHSQRLETIGTLAGGIAHDFNNILTPVMGCIELARLELGEGTEAREQLEVALDSSRRARDLVQQILTFSRQADPTMTAVDLREVVGEVARLLDASLPHSIELVTDIAPEVGHVRGNASQLHQLVMNLGTNAYQAMAGGGGRLELRLDETTLAATARGPAGAAPGRYVRLCVRDTGPGMPDEVRQRIFEPFFSTKPAGEGTGLGLSVVHGIVTAHEGYIEVESRPGAGTTFTVLVPVSSAAAEAPRDEVPVADGTRGRILLVDDEEVIADMASHMLEREGHDVVAVQDPQRALELFAADPQAFDLVITDQSMPGMTGTELAARLGAIAPGVRVIIATGFDIGLGDVAVPAGVHVVGRLQKPYSLTEIGRAVLQGLSVENP